MFRLSREVGFDSTCSDHRKLSIDLLHRRAYQKLRKRIENTFLIECHNLSALRECFCVVSPGASKEKREKSKSEVLQGFSEEVSLVAYPTPQRG